MWTGYSVVQILKVAGSFEQVNKLSFSTKRGECIGQLKHY